MSRHRLIEQPSRPEESPQKQAQKRAQHRLEEPRTVTTSPSIIAALANPFARDDQRRRRRSITATVLGVCCVPLLAAVLVSTGSTGAEDVAVPAALVAKHDSDHDRRQRHSAAPTTTPAPTTAPTTTTRKTPAPTTTTKAPDPVGAVGKVVASLFGGADSPWTQTIAANAPVDPGSAAMVRGMQSEKFQMSHELWTVPVYYADKSTPRSDVKITSGWQSASTLKSVPIPADAQPDPSEDAHLSIVDSSTQCVYDFWGARRSGNGLTAMTANAIPTDSDGIYPDGNGTRGSGFSAAAGIVTADELRKGEIDHALVFAFPNTRSGGPVAPATKSDGKSSGSDTIPEGARVRLDPSINLDSLGLTDYELIIARALQKYGMILGDTSGGFTIYSQHPQSLPAGAFNGLLPDDTWVDLSKIPTSEFQVMKLPEQTKNSSGTAANRCNGF